MSNELKPHQKRDRVREPDSPLERILTVARVLREPGGCPWDMEQTVESLTPYLQEETFEVVEADELSLPGFVGNRLQFAVLREARGRGIGRALMRAIEDRARTLGLDRVCLNGQLSALPFYRQLGYRAHGDVFLEAGIEHRAMDRVLEPDS